MVDLSDAWAPTYNGLIIQKSYLGAWNLAVNPFRWDCTMTFRTCRSPVHMVVFFHISWTGYAPREKPITCWFQRNTIHMIPYSRAVHDRDSIELGVVANCAVEVLGPVVEKRIWYKKFTCYDSQITNKLHTLQSVWQLFSDIRWQAWIVTTFWTALCNKRCQENAQNRPASQQKMRTWRWTLTLPQTSQTQRS